MSEDKTQLRASPPSLALKGVKGAYDKQLIEVSDTLNIGSQPSCDITIHSSVVSPLHALISRDGEDLLLADNDSSGGSFVNGARVINCRLSLGDTITFGDQAFSVVCRHDEPTSAEPIATASPASAPSDSQATAAAPVVESGAAPDDQQTLVAAAAIDPSDQQTLVAASTIDSSVATDDQQTLVASVDELVAIQGDVQEARGRGGSIQPPPAIKPVPAASMPAAKVVELVGRMEPVAGRVFFLNKPMLTVGRSPFNDIILKAESVSSHHAEIECQEGRWWLRDLFSSNGSYINGVRVEEQELLAGDIVMFGELALDFDPAGKDDSIADAKPSTEANSNVGLIIGAAVGGFVLAMLASYFLLR